MTDADARHEYKTERGYARLKQQVDALPTRFARNIIDDWIESVMQHNPHGATLDLTDVWGRRGLMLFALMRGCIEIGCVTSTGTIGFTSTPLGIRAERRFRRHPVMQAWMRTGGSHQPGPTRPQ